MIYHRKSGRLVPTLRVRHLRHEKHEAAAGSEFELIGNRLALYSGDRCPTGLRAQLERTVPLGKNSFQFRKLTTDKDSVPPGVCVVKADLEQSPVHKPGLQSTGIVPGKGPLGGGYLEDFQLGLLSGQLDGLVELLPYRPVNKSSRRIPPVQSKGRLQRFCSPENRNAVNNQKTADQKSSHPDVDPIPYSVQLKTASSPNSHRISKRGSVLIEAIVALTLLLVVSLVVLKGTMNILAPRQWTMVQNVSDAYLSYEKAYAQRIPFENLTDASSPWPVYPAKSEKTVTLGTLPGGRTLSGNVIRTRVPDENNFPAHGGSATLATNPAEMQTWILQSHVTYMISGREYVKSRTIVRTQ